MTCPISTMNHPFKERRFYLLVMVLFVVFLLNIFNLMSFPFNVWSHLIVKSGKMTDTKGYDTAHYSAKKKRKPKLKILSFKDINLWNRTLNPSIYGPVEEYLPETMDKRTFLLKRRMHPTEEDYHNIASGKYKPVDIMTLGPFKFHEQYRNPCWFEDEESDTSNGLKCLPYFYLIGAPKCGTTDLQRRLVQHPDISDRIVKEPQWFSRNRFCKYSATFFEGIALGRLKSVCCIKGLAEESLL
ncbi:uncharacterized protein LOC123541018 [Mercenaria mercenaria]|uniref:uncharacterized protein LOC123541018 n=1 Tax=Mercenaria mercenaria TaxID=6596 RepID=UPI00234EA565|nr:uncharacterized protein LOC123541018 [Mercenaria mercenaria]